MYRELEDLFGIGWALNLVGYNALFAGDPVLARPRLEESLTLFAGTGDVSAMVLHLADFAMLAIAEDRYEAAALLAGAWSSLREARGVPDTALNEIPGLERAVGSLGEETFRSAFSRGESMTLEEAVAYARSSA